MAKDYFQTQQEKNKNILLELAKAVVKGLVFISSIRIEKNMVGGGYRLVAFFSKKGEL